MREGRGGERREERQGRRRRRERDTSGLLYKDVSACDRLERLRELNPPLPIAHDEGLRVHPMCLEEGLEGME